MKKDDLFGTLFVIAVLGSALALLVMFPWLILVFIVLMGINAFK
jgi:F0F1-type ATP synthase membrane subunit c/vacuolar-type H+-ATPase subunit K